MSTQFYCNTCENEDSFTLDPRSGLPVCSECSSTNIELTSDDEEFLEPYQFEYLSDEDMDSIHDDLDDMFR